MSKPIVFVRYAGIQEGFAHLPARALFNITSGAGCVGSTVTLESLTSQGLDVREEKNFAEVTGVFTPFGPGETTHSRNAEGRMMNVEVGGAL